MMYLQDTTRNSLFKVSDTTLDAIARNIVDGEKLDKPKGKCTSGKTLKEYYEWWRDEVCKGIGVRLDEKRLFDDKDKEFLRSSVDGKCQVCQKPVEACDEEFDHYPIPYRDGGRTVPENGRLVHGFCHPRGRPVDES